MARRVHNSALLLAKGLADAGNKVENGLFFDTIKVSPLIDLVEIRHRAMEMEVNLRYFEDGSVSNMGERQAISGRNAVYECSSGWRVSGRNNDQAGRRRFTLDIFLR